VRIIPISSGKGGVGKSTLALNYALTLARHGRTILVDLDTGTSSIRNCIDTPVPRDLYHFFKKGTPLGDCVTSLSASLDPRGEFRNFGFVAGPKHLIEDITNFNKTRRDLLIDAINGLTADYVILDLRAGLDQGVIDFLPYSNSGILVFTPHMAAATMAASDIVKAILFRKLRAMFLPGAPIYRHLEHMTSAMMNAAIDRAEDVYDDSIPNLDAFVAELQAALGEHPAVGLVTGAVESFVVYYVLNMFGGFRDSFDTAVKPFVSNLAENVSAHLTILNLGWVIAHDDINRANQSRVPVLLSPEKPRARAGDAVSAEIAKLAELYLGAKPPAPRTRLPPAMAVAPRVEPARRGFLDPGRYLEGQLDTLRRMSDDLRGQGYRDNFEYIVYRSLHVARSRGAADFGDSRIYKESEVPAMLAARGR
jgi:MinD-like ATPase involved in chromosome partitioning or flagellar assembly